MKEWKLVGEVSKTETKRSVSMKKGEDERMHPENETVHITVVKSSDGESIRFRLHAPVPIEAGEEVQVFVRYGAQRKLEETDEKG